MLRTCAYQGVRNGSFSENIFYKLSGCSLMNTEDYFKVFSSYHSMIYVLQVFFQDNT